MSSWKLIFIFPLFIDDLDRRRGMSPSMTSVSIWNLLLPIIAGIWALFIALILRPYPNWQMWLLLLNFVWARSILSRFWMNWSSQIFCKLFCLHHSQGMQNSSFLPWETSVCQGYHGHFDATQPCWQYRFCALLYPCLGAVVANSWSCHKLRTLLAVLE